MTQNEIIEYFANIWVENCFDSFDFEQNQNKIFQKIEELERDGEEV